MYWPSDAGGAAATEADDDITDLTGDMVSDPASGPISNLPSQTAKGSVSYDVDWDGIEAAPDPCLAAVKLLHVARQMVGTSRWWTVRWPQNTVSLIGRADKLSPGKTYKLTRALGRHRPVDSFHVSVAPPRRTHRWPFPLF